MPCPTFRLFAIATSILLSNPIATAAPLQSLEEGLKKLVPLKDFDLTSTLGQRDVQKQLTDLEPSSQAKLAYGAASGDGQVLVADMTLYANESLPIVTLERFDGLTSAIDCKGDDGEMSLTFTSSEAFDYAVRSWSNINKNEQDQFLLIANHQGCGPDDERQPYLISHVTEEKAKLTIVLKDQIVAWQSVAGDYEITFGKADANQGPKVLSRGLGDIEKSLQGSYALDAGTPNNRTSLISSSSFGLDCISCYIKGSVNVIGRIKVKYFTRLEALSIEARPKGFNAELSLEAALRFQKDVPTLSFDQEILSVGIPGAGFSIPKILKVGAVVSYGVGFSTSFHGSATFDFGIRSSVPDSAFAKIDIMDQNAASADGFKGAVDPHFDVKSVDGGVTFKAYSVPKLSLGIDILGVGEADASLSLRLPEIDTTLDAKYDGNGVCSQDSSHKKTGILVESKAFVAVLAGVEASAFGKGKSYSKQLWKSDDFTLGGACFPLDIPGLGK